jgi:hypothetical protein
MRVTRHLLIEARVRNHKERGPLKQHHLQMFEKR